MNKVLKYFWLLAAAAMMFSCQKETGDTPDQQASNEPEEQSPASDPATQDLDPDEYLVGFSAGIENVESKVAVNLSDNSLSFEGGDEVLVVTVNKSGKYVYDSSDGFFKPARTSDAVPVGNARAYYPYSEFSADGTDVTFTMPASVTAGSAEDLGDKVPMAALISSDGVAQFKNLGSILRVRFNSEYTDGETISDVELSVTGANITGSCDVSWSDDTPSISSLDGTTSLRIGTANGHLTSGEYKEFYFFLPASGTLTAMTIKAIYGKTGGYEPYETIRRTSEMILARNQIITIKKPLKGFFSGGDGTADYPYQISNVEDLQNLQEYWLATSAETDAHLGYNGTDSFFGHAEYRQTANLDFSGKSFYVTGTNSKPFYGVYDGGGNTISNITKTGVTATYAGLFGYTKGATIRNLNLSNFVLSSSASYVGAVVGRMDGGLVEYCTVDANSSIIGSSGVGGIVGGFQSTSVFGNHVVSHCTNNASVTAPKGNNVGGIVGYAGSDENKTGTIQYCTNSGTVTGVSQLGGITGKMTNGTITECTNNGYVTSATGMCIGGIVGITADYPVEISNVTNTKDINGVERIGGIIGENRTGNIRDNCVNSGNVEGKYYIGGFVGYHKDGVIGYSTTPSYNSGTVKATGYTEISSGNKVAAVGGLIGRMDGGSVGDTQNALKAENRGAVQTTSEGKHVGGIVGILTNGTVAYAYNAGNVTGGVGGYTGGVVGQMGNNTAFVRVEKCRANATVSSDGTGTGGIVGVMFGGVLNTCFAKGSVTSSSYDVGGIAGQIYANGNSGVYNRPYVYDCIAANDVTSTRAGGSGNVGGVIGRIIRNASYTDQYAAVDNCLGLNQNITSSLQYTGAFVGYVNAAATNNNHVRVRNCISLVDDSHFHVTTTANNTGGFVGAYLGYLVYCYYLVSDNKQTAVSGTTAANNLTKSTPETLTGSAFCTAHSGRATGYNQTVNSVQYKSSGWTFYADGPYPVPATLYDLGEDYYK